MTDQALRWLDGLPDLSVKGVTGVPGVTPQKTVTSAVTPLAAAGVLGVPEPTVGTPVTPGASAGVTFKPAEMRAEHQLHPEHLKAVSLLAVLADGVAQLGQPPRRCIAAGAIWTQVVADAQRLLDGGIAEQALALGWVGHDLFGIGQTGSDEWLSLAVWLAGKRVTLLDDHRAFTAEGPVYYLERWGRPNTHFDQPIYLWEWAA